jgi:hypothetical protein
MVFQVGSSAHNGLKENFSPTFGHHLHSQFCKTRWSLLGPGVEVGLTHNIMKGIKVFTVDIIKDYSCNYGRIIQVLWKKGSKTKKILILKLFEKWCHIALSNFRLRFEPLGLPPLNIRAHLGQSSFNASLYWESLPVNKLG